MNYRGTNHHISFFMFHIVIKEAFWSCYMEIQNLDLNTINESQRDLPSICEQ